MDKRKNYYLIIDVETAGGLGNPLVYDLGFAIVDKKGNIYEEKSFVIDEIFSQKNLMESAYYSEKVPMYELGIENGTFTVVDWLTAISTMNELAVKYNTKTVSAYNLAFDKRALSNTHKNLGHNTKVLDSRLKGIEELCIWGLACETIFKQKTYTSVAVAQGWVSEAKNMRTNAEVAYRYISGNYTFEEEHTGLSDVKIEAQIMAHAFKQNKKISKGIISHPWRIPNK